MRTRFTDHDLTFYLQVYRDYARARWCLTHLRRHYPDSRVIVCSDGDPDPRFARLVDEFRVEYHVGQRMYPLQYGGRMLERMLLLWGMDTDYLFSIDPDTKIERRFRWLPSEDLAIFGDCEPTQGGCQGFTRSAGSRLVDSGLLRDRSWRGLPNPGLCSPMVACSTTSWSRSPTTAWSAPTGSWPGAVGDWPSRNWGSPRSTAAGGNQSPTAWMWPSLIPTNICRSTATNSNPSRLRYFWRTR